MAGYHAGILPHQPPGVVPVVSVNVTNDSGQDNAADWAMRAFRAAEEYVAAAQAADLDALSAVRQLSEAMGLSMAEVTAAAQKLSEKGMVRVGQQVVVGPRTTVKAIDVLDADTITISESATILPLEDIGELTARASRDGIAGFSTVQVLAVILVWLLLLGAPVAQQALPPEAQALLSNEYGTVSLALAITALILSRKR